MSQLALYDAARAALAECIRIDEAKDIRNKAVAIEAYARQAKDFELEANAVELRERATRRLGILIKSEKDAGRLSRGGRPVIEVDEPPGEETGSESEPVFDRTDTGKRTLAELGVTKKLSFEAQRKASIGEEEFESRMRVMRIGVKEGKSPDLAFRDIDRERNSEARTNLQQALSDESAKLEGGRKFPVIYADPATKFLAGLGPKSTENHYKTMTTDELCRLPVITRLLPSAELFVWSTVPQLANTFRIAAEWGFLDYSSHIVWDKTDADHPNEMGPGFVFRNQHELLLRFTRGNPSGPKVKPLSIYRERKREHSRKPDWFRTMIADMTGGLPVLELFARVDAEHPLPQNFYAWGNQAEDSTDRPAEVAAVYAASDAHAVDESASLETQAKAEEAVRPDTAQAKGMLPRGEEGRSADDAASRPDGGRSPDTTSENGRDGSERRAPDSVELANALGSMPTHTPDDHVLPDFLKRDRDNRASLGRT